MPNRLAGSLSPYLRQHQDNPVDWWPWSDEAWAKAKAENKPVFLSVGYSSCHWCHVMAHESFENEEVGAALNRDFVSIKLDREEHPDIDEVYMTAVQLSSGHGGWPMSVFLTPDKKPFFAGTYFPRDSRGEYPGFLTIIGSLAKAWRDQQADVEQAANEFANALAAALDRTLPTDLDRLDVSILDQAVDILHQQFDNEHGSFGDKPKFPPHAALRFLLDYASLRHQLGGDPGDLPERAGHMALFTLEQMALGGLYDHVGGGFHRYSTDERWLLPHFEKMLYDNAQLIGAYHHAAQVSPDPRLRSLFERVVKRTVQWLGRDMTSADGLFSSALDADSNGHEGAHIVWTKAELERLELPDDFLLAYQVRSEGNFHDEATGQLTGENVLHLLVDQGGKFDGALDMLLAARQQRTPPGLDDKALASWNGLMIGALSQCGDAAVAKRAAAAWKSLGELPHMAAQDQTTGAPFLDDLAYFADGLLDLAEATADAQWREWAETLADMAVHDFVDHDGGFFFKSHSGDALFGRTKPCLDNATPSPNGIMGRVLRRLGRHDQALKTVGACLGWVQRVPHGTETVLREILWLLLDAGQDSLPLPSGTVSVQKTTVRLQDVEVPLDEEGWGYTTVSINVPEGSHINSNEPLAKWLVPTSVQVDGVYGEASFPESKEGTYTGETLINVRLRPKGAEREFALSVRYQVCTDTACLAPEEVTLTGRLL